MRFDKILPVISILALVTALSSTATDQKDGDSAIAPEVPLLKSETLPALGQQLAIEGCDNKGFMILASPSQFWSLYMMVVDDVKYQLGVDDSCRVRYISTYDSTFVTQGSLSVLSTVREAKRKAVAPMSCASGWGYVLPLPSGWTAAWCIGYTCTDSLPRPDEPVGWFFKGGN